MRLCSNEYFTRTPRRGKARARRSTRRVFAPMNCSQLIGGLAGVAICGTVALMNLFRIGRRHRFFLLLNWSRFCDRSRLRDGFYCYYSGLRFRAEVVCRPKLRTSFSSDDNRVAKSLRPRFALFALASANKWQDAKSRSNRPMTMRIRSSICFVRFGRIIRLCWRG